MAINSDIATVREIKNELFNARVSITRVCGELRSCVELASATWNDRHFSDFQNRVEQTVSRLAEPMMSLENNVNQLGALMFLMENYIGE